MKKIKHLPKLDGDLGWFETAANKDQTVGRQLKGDVYHDVVIVGAGFTGMSLAHRLHQLYPDKSIAVVDALKVGQGTSGRNAGFIIDLPHNLDAGTPNVAHDLWLYRLNTFAINRLKAFKNEFAIECLWDEAGKYMAAHESSNLQGLADFMQILKTGSFEHEYLEGAALQKKLGTDYYQAAVYTPGNILMNPAALVRGIAKGLSQHVTIYEQTPIIAIDYGTPTRLYTVGGSIRADQVIHTTNAFTEEFGIVSRRLAPVFTYASLTNPLSAQQISEGFAGVRAWGLTSAHPAGTTVRLTPDHRILMRNSLDFLPQLSSTEALRQVAWQQHKASFAARFPALGGVDFQYTWGGMLCMTLNHQSVFQQISTNVYAVCGCNGVGVAKGTYLGHYMADYIAGIDSEALAFILSSSQPSWVPPEPFRSLGARYKLKQEAATAGGDI